MKPIKLYSQIACVPYHLQTSPQHQIPEGAEFGFVMSIPKPNEDGTQDYFCRYWQRGQPGLLRTTMNSERTSGDMIRLLGPFSKYLVPQFVVMDAVRKIITLGVVEVFT